LNRFAARYRAAKLFDGIQHTPNATEEWRRGFSALLNVFLAYTAAESLLTGYRLYKMPFEISLTDDSLAEELRGNKKLIKLLIAETGKVKIGKKLKEHLQKFENEKSNDVGRVAKAIRNLVAHGTLTVDGANVDSLERSNCLLKLAEAVLELSNREFSEFCKAAVVL
jgi:hypothetical protein